MSTAGAFASALEQITALSPEPALLPDRVARACLAALPVDGVGLSYTFTPGRRLPIGASGPDAATAERLQFALGDGPCFEAQRTGRAVAADLARLRSAWPFYADGLAGQTPYSSVLAVPVAGPLSGFAAIDLFASSPNDATTLPAEDVQDLVVAVGEAMASGLIGAEDRVLGGPAWLGAEPVAGRQQVWLAIGYLAGHTGDAQVDAFARLRAHAFRHDLDLETAATRVLGGELPAW